MNYFEFTDYREYLQALLESKRVKKPAYSLRAFARDLGISASRLSEVLSGQSLSLALAEKVSVTFQDEDQRSYFLNLVLAQESKNTNVVKQACEKIEQLRNKNHFNILELERFHTISDWYHFAFLEYFKLRQKFDLYELSTYFSLPLASCYRALERLKKSNLVDYVLNQEAESGREIYTVTLLQQSNFVDPKKDSQALKIAHRQILALADRALVEQPITKRLSYSMMVSLSPDELKNFEKKLLKLLQESTETSEYAELSSKRQVYCMTHQVFSLAHSDVEAVQAE
ncbi:MAG: TIGR02147 family protein [Oligoflexales bacterium]|nr:TIGR02147 family protein [Oligoflexales bacterium]